LSIDQTLSEFSKVRAILLDLSCSGSGTTVQRLDRLLSSARIESSKGEPEFDTLVTEVELKSFLVAVFGSLEKEPIL